jgi:hypothetical protein
MPAARTYSLVLASTRNTWYFARSEFRGKELAWISEMPSHAGKGKFGGAVERAQK